MEGDRAVKKLGRERNGKQGSKSDSECEMYRKVKDSDELHSKKVRSDDDVVRRRRTYQSMSDEDENEDLTIPNGMEEDESEDNSINERSEEDPIYCIKVNEEQEKKTPSIISSS